MRPASELRPPGDVLPKTLVLLEHITPPIESHDDLRAVLHEQARDLPWAAEEGWELEFWGLQGVDSRTRAKGRFRIRGPRLPVKRLWTPARVALGWLTHFVLTLSRPQAGILIAASPVAGAGAAAASVLLHRRPPLVVRVQGRTASKALMVKGSRSRYLVLNAIERFVLRHADLVVPMGRYTTELASQAGVPSRKIVMLPFPPGWRDPEVQPVIARDERGQTVVCAARLEREKGIDILLRAFVQVSGRCPQAELRIAGHGPQRAELEGLAERLGIGSRVEFAGWLPAGEMAAFFGAAQVAVLPSRWEEGLGMMLVEAGLAGCTLVASDLGGIRDIVRPGVSGHLVPPEDPDALARALIHCLTDGDERIRLGAGALEVATAYVARREPALREFSQLVDELRSHR